MDNDELDEAVIEELEELERAISTSSVSVKRLAPEVFGRTEVTFRWICESGSPAEVSVSRTREDVMKFSSLLPHEVAGTMLGVGGTQLVTLLVSMSHPKSKKVADVLYSICSEANLLAKEAQLDRPDAAKESLRASLRMALVTLPEEEVRRTVEEIMTVERIHDE